MTLIKTAEPPFPWMAMSSICLGMLAHSVVFTSPLPFVAFMVVDFGMADNVDTAGYSAGWITGSFMIGRTVAALPWGLASDKWGRKPCLILSMVNVAVIGLLFGFSSSFPMAVILRFLMGLGNGFMCVAKTCVSEIVTTKSHEMRAFGYLNSIWGLGLIVGPALGGMLSRGAVQYPGVFSSNSIWGQFPYLLPCLVCAVIAAAAGIWIAICLPETLGNNRTLVATDTLATDSSVSKDNSDGESVDDSVGDVELVATSADSKSSLAGWMRGKSVVGDKHKGVGFQRLSSTDVEEGATSCDEFEQVAEEDEVSTVGEAGDSETTSTMHHRLVHSGGEVTDSSSGVPGSSGYSKVADCSTEDATADTSFIKGESTHNMLLSSDEDVRDVETGGGTDISSSSSSSSSSVKGTQTALPKTVSEMLHSVDIQIMCGIYLAFCFVIMFIDESFPLWGVTSVQKGGLAWDSAQVGGVLACVGMGLVVFQIFLYERMMRLPFFSRGSADTYAKLCLISAAAICCVPVAAGVAFYINSTKTSDESKKNVFAYLSVIVFLMLYRTSAGSAFTTLGIVINSSVDQSLRGTMNGLIMTAGSLGNALGPIIGSICYASSLRMPQFLGPIPLDGRVVFVLGGLMAVLLSIWARAYMKNG